MGAPDKPVFSFMGDGAWVIGGLAEVMTVAREKIPVIAIVANNHVRSKTSNTAEKVPIHFFRISVLSGHE